jgi:hypothetical protein
MNYYMEPVGVSRHSEDPWSVYQASFQLEIAPSKRVDVAHFDSWR